VNATVHELPSRAHAAVAPDRYWTTLELAAHLRVTDRTIRRWVREGCPSHPWGARLRRFRLAEVEAWLNERAARTMVSVDKRPGSAMDAPGPAPRLEVVMQEQRSPGVGGGA
jgi:excisionase family DNA binding protein